MNVLIKLSIFFTIKTNIQIAVVSVLYAVAIVFPRRLIAGAFVFSAETMGMCLISILWLFQAKNLSLKSLLYASAGALLLIFVSHLPLYSDITWSELGVEFIIQIPLLFIAALLSFRTVNAKSKSVRLFCGGAILSIAAGIFFLFPFYVWETNAFRTESELSNSSLETALLRFDTASQESLKDKTLVIGVWNSKCGFCKRLLRHMQNLSERESFKSDTSKVLVALNDGKPDSYEVAVYEHPLVKQLPGLKFWYTSDKKLYQNLNFLGAPTMIIMRNGKILSVVNGYILDAEFLYNYFIEREIRKVANL